MTEPARIDFPLALDQRHEPTVGVWNRLEGRPRTTDFGRALRAEVRDPLWMLTRQWQMGEFLGTDGGSPVTATYSVSGAPPSRFRPPAGPVEPLDGQLPLESVAERRPLQFRFGDADPVAFDLRLALGHRWFKLIRGLPTSVVGNFREQYATKYPIALPNPLAVADTPRAAHPEVWATMQAASGRCMDGYLLYRHLKYDGGLASDGIVDVHDMHYETLNRWGRELLAWFDGLISQPTGEMAWDPARLEHRFTVAAGTADGEQVLTAPEYPGGELEWHAFSVDASSPLGGTAPVPRTLHRTVFPAPVRFSGMPLPRWWAVEDGRTNFTAVRPDSTDLSRLVFLEFALVYSNDWYQLPCDLPAGVLAGIRGLSVTDVFGEQLWITPAGTRAGGGGGRWSMFTLDSAEGAPSPLLLPPGGAKVAEGPVLEDVLLVRDEQANLVWGVEQTVRVATGEPRRGSEVSAESVAHRLRLGSPVTPGDGRAPVAYQAMNSVPENWIPFIAVHTDTGNRSVRLQRAAMPHAVDGLEVRPRTELLRAGLDLPSGPRAYYVNEEEVPTSGTRLTLAYNRTRCRDGRVVVWLSARRGAGRGEVSSGLAFDRLVPVPRRP